MDPINPQRILRRLAGRMRAEAARLDDKEIVVKLILMAAELEELARQLRAGSARRN